MKEMIELLDKLAEIIYQECPPSSAKWQAMSKIEELKIFVKSGNES